MVSYLEHLFFYFQIYNDSETASDRPSPGIRISWETRRLNLVNDAEAAPVVIFVVSFVRFGFGFARSSSPSS